MATYYGTQSVTTTILGGTDYTTASQSFILSANYGNVTNVTVPYSGGNATPVYDDATHPFVVNINSGTPRLLPATDYTIDHTTAGQFIVQIAADKLKSADENVSGLIALTITVPVQRTVA